jgi:two-component system sensor histidine kinase UhpB
MNSGGARLRGEGWRGQGWSRFAVGARRAVPLFWRVFATNALILAVATVVLAASPATVSFPVAATEAVVLTVGLCTMVALNLALLRRAFGPLQRLKRFMGGVDPLAPGRRVPVDGADPEVAELTEAFNEMIERLETERRESARRALAAQESERLRIARDLHDEVGQTLTGVMLQLQQAIDGPPERVRGAAEHAREDVRASLEEVRQIARRLRPEALDHLGLASALAALTTEVTRQSGIDIGRRIEGHLPELPPEKDVVVYRVAQEALTNVARHSRATRGELELAYRDGDLVLLVRDDGIGLPEQVEWAGAGIRGMRERALMIGAELDIRSGAGAGTEVRLTLPVDQR